MCRLSRRLNEKHLESASVDTNTKWDCDIVSMDKEPADKTATSSTRSSRTKDSTGARGGEKQEEILLKTAMTLRRTTERRAGSDGLGATRDRSNVSLEPSTHNKFMLKAKQWKDRMALTVSSNLVALSTETGKKGSPILAYQEGSFSRADHEGRW